MVIDLLLTLSLLFLYPLSQLRVREFSVDSVFQDPCLSYTLRDVICSYCSTCRYELMLFLTCGYSTTKCGHVVVIACYSRHYTLQLAYLLHYISQHFFVVFPLTLIISVFPLKLIISVGTWTFCGMRR